MLKINLLVFVSYLWSFVLDIRSHPVPPVHKTQWCPCFIRLALIRVRMSWSLFQHTVREEEYNLKWPDDDRTLNVFVKVQSFEDVFHTWRGGKQQRWHISLCLLKLGFEYTCSIWQNPQGNTVCSLGAKKHVKNADKKWSAGKKEHSWWV